MDRSVDKGALDPPRDPKMVLEGSHRDERLRETYSRSDVDTYCECENRPGQRDA